MILTGSEIGRAWEEGDVWIDPFDRVDLNPNSVNFRLGEDLLELPPIGSADPASPRPLRPDADGALQLVPGRMYLGVTHEVIGSRRYIMTLLGRSSLGRLGLYLNVTADLGHLGSASRWTLELTVVQPLQLYVGMRVGQVAFWEAMGPRPQAYTGRYDRDNGPVPSRDRFLSGAAAEEERR